MKVLNSSENIQSFGGLNFVFKTLSDEKVLSSIKNKLGQRGLYASFQYDDIFSNQLAIFFSGGDCAEDLSEHLKKDLQLTQGIKPCSPDTLLRMPKELAVEDQITTTDQGVTHTINNNTRLNELLLETSMQLNIISKKEDAFHVFDFDHQFIPTEKYDATTSYKKEKGYFPAIGMLNNIPLQIENRNGNSGVKFNTASTIENMLINIKKHIDTLHATRMDCGYYTKDIVDLAEEHCEKFYIRAQRCDKISKKLPELSWQKVRIGTKEFELATIEDYQPFGEEKKYRLVLSRTAKKSGQLDLETQTAYTYRGILTNDKEKTAKQITEFYNQRGACERVFDEMNNDFGWTKLPFSFLSENTAYLLLTALIRNIYVFIKDKYAQVLDWIKPTDRMKKFIFRFITLPSKWIKTARQEVLKLYSDKDYSPVLA